MNNNKLVVNTDLNTTEFDNKYNKLEKKAEEFSKKDIEKKVDLEVKDNFDSNAKDIYKLSEQLEDIYNEYNKIRQSPIISKTDLDYSNQLKQDMLEIAKQYKKITGQKLQKAEIPLLYFLHFLICFYDIQKVTVLLPFEKCG